MIRLPVCKIEVELRQATGAEDMLLLEGGSDVVQTSIALVQRLAYRRDGEEWDAAALPVPDLEALLLEMRHRWFGDVVASRGRCPVEECGTVTDVSFRISEYLTHHRALLDQRRLPGNVAVLPEQEWFQLTGSEVQFRLVTAGDLAAAVRAAHPEQELARRTIRTESARGWKRAQTAMEALAPPLSGEIEGQCPECGARARFWFDAQSYVQREMRYEAEFLYQDVHLLARNYHWSEEKILSLPSGRRVQYAELLMRGAGGD
ncbi:MAG TPA: hypothetical protein VGN17_26780 [Bryobacteraceae bacterium]|jgi:hypothetical protein